MPGGKLQCRACGCLEPFDSSGEHGEQRNKKILDEVKKAAYKDFLTILKEIDQELLKGAVSGENFAEYFFANCKDTDIKEYIQSVVTA